MKADVGAARSYMQRGLRFCGRDRRMYVEYARLEMDYLAKIAKRRKVLGIGEKSDARVEEAQVLGEGDHEADVIALPTITAGEMRSETDGPILDESTLRDISITPAMNGAIPLAIFDAAMKQFPGDLEIAHTFFDMFADFIQVPCCRSILQTVLDRMSEVDEASPCCISCRCRLHVTGVAFDDPAFPAAVRMMVKDLRSALNNIDPPKRGLLSEKVLAWLTSLANDESMGPEVKQVLQAIERQYARELAGSLSVTQIVAG